jgi:antitoxin component HigA of HigAB toxin-antitoxin module
MAFAKYKVAADYLELVRRFPLAPIRDKRSLKDALTLIDELGIIDEDRLTPGEADYLLVLSDLVERYEHAHSPVATPFRDGVDALEYLMGQARMSSSDLGRLLGNRQLGAAIVRRERELSKAHVVKLAEHFKVSTDLFLRPHGFARKAS